MHSYTAQEVLDLFTYTTSKPNKPKHQSTKSVVYAVICNATKHVYVGSGLVNCNGKCNRLAYHRSKLSKGNHPSKAMQADFTLYPKSFDFKIIETCTSNEARQREQLTMIRIKQLGKYQLYNRNNSYKF